MRAVRRAAVEAAAPARRWGLVLGTLGRQGNPRILEHLRGVMERKGLEYTLVLLSEVRPWASPGHVTGYIAGYSGAQAQPALAMHLALRRPRSLLGLSGLCPSR